MPISLIQIMIVGCVSALLVTQAFGSPSLVKEWSVERVFNMPESAAFDPVGQQIFVSNVNEYAKDGNGFISRVSADGSELEQKWLSGLNSPTGLAVQGNLLYAVDFDELVIVDINESRVLTKVPAPHQQPSLNDVAVSQSGQAFVSGSSSSSIYVLENNSLQVWKQDAELLKHANGLLVDGDKLVYGGTRWLIFDLESKQVDDGFLEPAPQISEIDGISSDGCQGYFITLIDDDRLWHVNASSEARAVSDAPVKGIDIDYHDGRLYVPVVGGGLSVFKVDGAPSPKVPCSPQ